MTKARRPGPPASDVLIVGGGVVALALAEALVLEGATVRLIEADQVGAGAEIVVACGHDRATVAQRGALDRADPAGRAQGAAGGVVHHRGGANATQRSI